MRRSIPFLLLALPLFASAQAGPSAGRPVEQLATAEAQPYGTYLTDGQGRALYMFGADDPQAGTSACEGACAQAWPPALGSADVELAPALDRGQLGTIARQDGTEQLTYGGWPLYYFVQDQGPGDVEGQGVVGFGGPWYLLGPDGQVIRAQR